MKLSEVKNALNQLENVTFLRPDGEPVPAHFHVTEVGLITKRFIDCGGTIREESVVNFQLWTADDFDHRLSTEKLKAIIELSEKKLGLDEDFEVEVEYQMDTIGRFGLEFNGESFLLEVIQTDCLAKDKCGIIPPVLPVIKVGSVSQSNCAPGSGCC